MISISLILILIQFHIVTKTTKIATISFHFGCNQTKPARSKIARFFFALYFILHALSHCNSMQQKQLRNNVSQLLR